MTARHQFGAFGLADGNVFHNFIQLLFVDAGPHVRRGIQTVAYAKRLYAFDEAVQKLLVDLFVNGYAACGRASLTCGTETAPDSAINGKVQIRILEHD